MRRRSDLLDLSCPMNFRTFCVPLLAAAAFFVHLGHVRSQTIPYDSTNTALTPFNNQWSVQGSDAFNDGNATTDDRFILRQAGTSNQWVSPVKQVEKNSQTAAVDLHSAPQDQWNTCSNPQ